MGLFKNKKPNNVFTCEQCGVNFNSNEEFNEHQKQHTSGVSCESCPFDIAIEKILKLFKRK